MSENISTVTAEGAEPVQQPVVDETAAPVVGSGSAAEPSGVEPAKPEDPGKDETPPWLKAEITKERNRRRAAEEETQRLKEQVDRLTKAIEPKPQEERASSKPNRNDFFDPEEYETALTEWITETVTSKVQAKVEEKTTEATREQAAARHIQETQKAWSAQVETAKKSHPDFEEIVYSDDFQCSTPMMNAIVADINGAEVAYHLGQNPEEASKIAELPPVQQIIEIGRLSATLQAKPAAEPRRAPAPIRPLGNEAPAVNKGPAEESEAEYFARRKSEAKAKGERLF
jgi:hypothetical protein